MAGKQFVKLNSSGPNAILYVRWDAIDFMTEAEGTTEIRLRGGGRTDVTLIRVRDSLDDILRAAGGADIPST